MNFKNKRSLLLVFLLVFQSTQVRAGEENKEASYTFSLTKTVVLASFATSLGLFLGYQLGKFIRERSEKTLSDQKNKMLYWVAIPQNIHTINIESSSFSILIKGEDNNNDKVKANRPDYRASVSNGILTIHNNTYNVFSVPSGKMVSATTLRGDVTVADVNSVSAKVYGPGNITLYDIKCGIFGHTQCGNINVEDSKVHNTMRFVNVSTGAGNVYFKFHTGNQRTRQFPLIFHNFSIFGGNVIGNVAIGAGNLIIKEV